MDESSFDITFATALGTPLPQRSTTPWSPVEHGDQSPAPHHQERPNDHTSHSPSHSPDDSPSDHDLGNTPPLQRRRSADRPCSATTQRVLSAPDGESPRLASPSERQRNVSSQSPYRPPQDASPLTRSTGSIKDRAREYELERQRENDLVASPYRDAPSGPSSAACTPSHSPLSHKSASRSTSSASSPGMARAVRAGPRDVSAFAFPSVSELRAVADDSFRITPANASLLGTRSYLNVRRRESSPGLNASRLGGMNFGTEESFLGSVGDRTYDELEVAVADNNRRKSFGIALRAPLPPSPDSTFDDLEPQSPISPSLRRSPPSARGVGRGESDAPQSTPRRTHSPDAPAVRLTEVDNDALAMPPPPVPHPRDQIHGHLRTPSTASQRYSPRRASPLRETFDDDPPQRSEELRCRSASSVASTELTRNCTPSRSSSGDSARLRRHESISGLADRDDLVRQRTASTTSAFSTGTEGTRLRRHESVSTLGSLGGGSVLRNSLLQADSLRGGGGLEQSFRFERIDRMAAASRLDNRAPDLLDASSFRLSPPRTRPSAREIFEEKESLASSLSATPRTRTFSHSNRLESTQRTPARTPARTLRPISIHLDASVDGNMTMDLQQLIQRSARKPLPGAAGAEESLSISLLGHGDKLADLQGLADLSDADDFVPRRHHVSMPPPLSLGRERVAEPDLQRGAADADADDAGVRQRPSSIRSLSSGTAATSGGLQRSDSVRSNTTMQRSDSTRSGSGTASTTRGLQRSDSTRSGTTMGGLQRSDSARSGLQRANSGRRLPISSSSRTLALGTGTPRDRADVPLSMRGRAQQRAGITRSGSSGNVGLGGIPKSTSVASATSEDRWADAIERDSVPELRSAAPSTATTGERRGLTSSSSSRRLNPGPGAGLTRTSSTRSSASASSSGVGRPLARTSSVRQALVAGSDAKPRQSLATGTRITTTRTSAPPGAVGPGPRASLAAAAVATTRTSAPPSTLTRPTAISSARTAATRASLASRDMPPPPIPSSRVTKTATSAPPAAGRTSLLPKSGSRPSLAPSLPKSSSRLSLAPSSSRTSLVPSSSMPRSSTRTSLAPGVPRSTSRPSLAPPTLPKSSSRPSLALPRQSLAPSTLPKSSSRPSLAPSLQRRPGALGDGTAAANRRPAAPGAGVALARAKLSAPAALDAPRPRPASLHRLEAVPATPAGRAPRAAMVPRTAVKAHPQRGFV